MGNSKSKTVDIDIKDDENHSVNIIVNRPNGVINKVLKLKNIKKASINRFYYYEIDNSLSNSIYEGHSFNIKVHLGFDNQNKEITKSIFIPDNYNYATNYDYLKRSYNTIDNVLYLDIQHISEQLILRHRSYKNTYKLTEIVLIKNPNY